ncbi:hypothetical protein HPB48_019917 [Haemaphysalis longicornis]|uniref:U6 snRNA-associated Sm-like protein LSm2 n=1 Tax=Haemaphysalis longicornis TaxID=44386 RepID=A0A9J6FRS9_HAELO|nr:hypothetical protein HPB48_019917 [Haemaphysalis longicornis]
MVWTSCLMPDNWCHSVAHAIPKRGKPTERLGNLQPISLTSSLCELLERIVLSRLNHHLEYVKPDFFDPSQTGFRNGLCTYDSIHLIKAAFNRRHGWLRQVAGLLAAVDLRKAFSTLFYSFFKSLVGKDVVVELKNDLSICGTLHSVDQYLNIKLTDISVTDTDKYPHMLSVKNCFIRGSVVRYVQLPADEVDTQLLQDAARKEASQSKP